MSDPLDPAVVFVPEDGATRAELHVEGRCASKLWIVPRTLRIGEALVRMDGIGGVETEEECRQRGYSRRVIEASIRRMRQGDAAFSMLYGIRDFYTRFGYVTAGPEHRLRLTVAHEPRTLPEGWTARTYSPADLPALAALYDANTADAVGAATRRAGEG
ncbi:MAG TPA: GNAT family N-acetyltransferase, partial [Chthonomonadales bacterium]|nr:GNAT family N-acetyltransferase [Chthonomonadales bacterium]